MSTYSKLYIQTVFGVKGRNNLIATGWRNELHKYISGIITNKRQKSIIVNGVGDHVHCFFGLSPSSAVSDIIRDVKNNSSKFINESGFLPGKFAWQDGYGAFSYSYEQIDRVYQYILKQEEHHKKITFKEEYLNLLNEFAIEYDPKYLFDWIE